jgi:hypothetical protein
MIQISSSHTQQTALCSLASRLSDSAIDGKNLLRRVHEFKVLQ